MHRRSFLLSAAAAAVSAAGILPCGRAPAQVRGLTFARAGLYRAYVATWGREPGSTRTRLSFAGSGPAEGRLPGGGAIVLAHALTSSPVGDPTSHIAVSEVSFEARPGDVMHVDVEQVMDVSLRLYRIGDVEV